MNLHKHVRLDIHNNIIYYNTNLIWQDEHICSLPTKFQKDKKGATLKKKKKKRGTRDISEAAVTVSFEGERSVSGFPSHKKKKKKTLDLGKILW